MSKHSLYLGVILVAGVILSGCSFKPDLLIKPAFKEETVDTSNQVIDAPTIENQDGVEKLPSQAAKQPSAVSSPSSQGSDLPSLESDLGTLTLEEESFE